MKYCIALLLVIFSINVFADELVNYPNPFSPGRENTKLKYTLTSDAEITIKIFTLTGELVFEKVTAKGEIYAKAGVNEFPWDGKNNAGETVKNGGYICKMIIRYADSPVTLKRKICAVR